MASNNKPITGEVTADATGVVVSTLSGELSAGVWLTIPTSEANGIEVISAATGFTTGDKMEVGASKFYPCNELDDLKVKRDGASDVTVSFYAL